MNEADRDRWLRQSPDLVGVHEATVARYALLLTLTSKLLDRLGVTPENVGGHDIQIQFVHALVHREDPL